MTKALTFFVALSLILAASGCQTLNNNKDKSANGDNQTDLSVAAAFLDSGKPDKAMFELRAVLEREPSNVKALTLMGLSQLALKNPRKAVEHLEKAWKLERSAQNALNLSSAYIENKQLDSAQKLIIKGLSLKETPPYRNKERFYHNLGLIAERRGTLVAAEKAYRKALEENPTFYLSRARLASMLEEKKKFDQAKEHWEIARQSCPGCFDATLHLSRYYEGKGDFKTALGLVRDYKRIEGLNPLESQKALELESELSASKTKSASRSSETRNR